MKPDTMELEGPAPSIANTESGNCIVIASGRCLWDDLEACPFVAKDHLPKCDVIGVNFAGVFWHNPLKHWVSIHGEYFKYWFTWRREQMKHEEPQTHSTDRKPSRESPYVKNIWPFVNSGGTSGLCAIYVALGLGYSKVILCGLPLDASGHFYTSPYRKHAFGNRSQEKCWENSRDLYFKDRVRSMSGKTKEIIGYPDDEWLQR
jgi:hypothetical protein